MGTNVAPPRNPAATNAALKQSPAPKPKAVLGPAAKIEAVRDHVVSTLLPLVEEFLAGKGADKRSDMHRRLGETIMAELLKLDGIETEDPQIRSRRKEVVREIQGYLDSLDKSLRESK